MFQFHKGAIKTPMRLTQGFRYFSFNSIKVRLRLTEVSPLLVVRQFQFHKGAIKTQLLMVLMIPYSSFNSIKVRLRPSRRNWKHVNYPRFNSIKVRLRPLPSLCASLKSPVSIP